MAISKEGVANNYVLINILYNTLRIMKLDFSNLFDTSKVYNTIFL